MPNIPVPCMNCPRFHYGTCYEAPKQCHECGGFNHIERYCPSRRRVTISRGEPLPGTRSWCEMWNLDDDPELKKRILNALKTTPSCAIWVNDQCIYRGNETHILNSSVPRGRPLQDRVTRRRSRSPPRDRARQRSSTYLKTYLNISPLVIFERPSGY